MQLPAFISRLAGFADKAEAQLDALSKSQSDNASLVEQVSALTASLNSAESKVKAALEDEAKKNSELTKEIEALKSAVAEAKKKSIEVVASQGLPIDQLPAASPESQSSKPAESMTLTEQCLAAKKKISVNHK